MSDFIKWLIIRILKALCTLGVCAVIMLSLMFAVIGPLAVVFGDEMAPRWLVYLNTGLWCVYFLLMWISNLHDEYEKECK